MTFFDIAITIAIALASFAVATFLLKKYAKAETFANLVSLVRTKKYNNILDGIAQNKWLSRLAVFGIIMGFGLLAVDYLYGRQQPLRKRIPLLLISGILLAVFFLIEPMGNIVLTSPLLPDIARIAIIISFSLFGFAGFTMVFMAYSAIDILAKVLSGITPCPGVAPIIPGIQFPNVPKEMTPPLHIWLTFFVLLLIHELSHGIMMRKAKITIKSFGLILLGYLPFGAFAEPEEKELKKAKPIDALKVYAAGPASNLYSIPFILAIMAIYSALIFVPFIQPASIAYEQKAFNGVIVSAVDENYSFCGTNYPNPAFNVLEKGMIIKEINGQTIKTPSDLAKASFSGTDTNLLVDKNGTLLEKTIKNANQFGLRAMQLDSIRNTEYKTPLDYSIIANANNLLYSFLQWLFLLSIAVATANFLPMDPFDGGRMIKILLTPYLNFLKMDKEQTEKLVGRAFLILIMALILLNALPLFLIK